MNKLLLGAALLLTACGNDPVTYAGYFDEDQDRSITNDNSNNGEQIYNNYGKGTMNITNNTGDNYIQYNKEISNTIDAIKISFQPDDFIAFIGFTNISADTLKINGSYTAYIGTQRFSNSLGMLPGDWLEIPPMETRSVSVGTGADSVSINSITFYEIKTVLRQYNTPLVTKEITNIWYGNMKFK